MQKKHIKLFILFFSIFSFTHFEATAVISPENLLSQADQLFVQKKYTESYKIYNELFTSYHKYTPQTLLKMAFIKEALGETTESLFYLNLLYEAFPDKKVFNKMKEIAEKEKLEGYVYSDLDFFSNIYRTYKDEILFGIMGLVFIYFLAVITNKIFIKGISNTSPIFFIVFMLGIFYMINYGEKYIIPEKLILLKGHSLLMDAPSAGAKFLGFVEKGNRVQILDETDIWYRVKLNDNTGFIRKSNFTLDKAI